MKINDILLESFNDAKRIFSQDEDKDTVSKYLDTFKDLAKRNVVKGQEKDIGKWIKAGWDDFKAFVDSKKEVQTNAQTKKAKKKDSIVVHEDDEKMVVIPLSKDSSCFYGKNTKWCTAATKSSNHFDDYYKVKEVTLIYVLRADGEKYAAALHEKSVSYFDAEDNAITQGEFEKETNITLSQMRAWVNEHSQKIARHRFPSEEEIAKDAELSLQYAKDFLKGRFIKGEEAIIGNKNRNINYFKSYIDHLENIGDIESVEQLKLFNKPNDAVRHAIHNRARFPEAEKYIAKDANASMMYAARVLKGQFPEGEDAIASSQHIVPLYVDKVLKKPFPKGEDTLINDSWVSPTSNFPQDYVDALIKHGHKKEANEFERKFAEVHGAIPSKLDPDQ